MAEGSIQLVGAEYYALKDRLIRDEQLLLRAMDFDIVIEHPHALLLNMCHQIKCSCAVVKMSLCFLNDSLLYSNLCLSCTPSELAAACVHLTSLCLGVAETLPSTRRKSWWDAFGVTHSKIEFVGHEIMNVLANNAKA